MSKRFELTHNAGDIVATNAIKCVFSIFFAKQPSQLYSDSEKPLDRQLDWSCVCDSKRL